MQQSRLAGTPTFGGNAVEIGGDRRTIRPYARINDMIVGAIRPVILAYHRIPEKGHGDALHVPKQLFRDQLAYLVDHGYHFLSLASWIDSLRAGAASWHAKQVVLTFDDGFVDFATQALPVLLEHKAPATVFLITGKLGQDVDMAGYGQGVRFMSEAEVRELRPRGISLGSHTVTHAQLTNVSDEELWRELAESKARLAELGEARLPLAYPWGQCTGREAAAAKAAGYTCSLSVGRMANLPRATLYRLGRMIVRGDVSLHTFGSLVAGRAKALLSAGIMRLILHHRFSKR